MIVAGNISGRAQTSKNTTSGGGSSSVLSSAFAEAAFRLSAGASTTTRRPPRCALREQKSINALTCSILISALWTRAFSAVEPVEAVALPFADSAYFRDRQSGYRDECRAQTSDMPYNVRKAGRRSMARSE